MNLVRLWLRLPLTKIRSWRAFVMPITLTGLHALSVEIAIANSTSVPVIAMARVTFDAPKTFVITASRGAYSHDGTCFSAAAWNTTWMPFSTPATES